jgi:hypothetical protein
MRQIGPAGKPDGETEAVIWVDPVEARQRLAETRNASGRKRDLAVLEAALQVLGGGVP